MAVLGKSGGDVFSLLLQPLAGGSTFIAPAPCEGIYRHVHHRLEGGKVRSPITKTGFSSFHLFSISAFMLGRGSPAGGSHWKLGGLTALSLSAFWRRHQLAVSSPMGVGSRHAKFNPHDPTLRVAVLRVVIQRSLSGRVRPSSHHRGD